MIEYALNGFIIMFIPVSQVLRSLPFTLRRFDLPQLFKP